MSIFCVSLDIQQLAVDLQSAIGLMGQNALCQELAQLHAFLVEGVDIPRKALEHDLVLKVGQQSAQGAGSQLIADDNAGGTAAGEVLVAVVVFLAAGEGNDLRCHIGAQLLLAGAALDHNIGVHLAVTEAHKLQRGDVGALVQELVEGVLAVGAGLAEDHGAGDIVDRLTVTVDGLAVGLHIQLLQVCGEAAQSLGVGQHRGIGIAQNIALVNADQSVQQGRVLQQILILGDSVSFGSAIEELGEDLGAKGQGQYDAAHTGGRGITAADEVVHVEGGQVIGILSHGRGLAGHGDHMLGAVQAGLCQSVLNEGFVGQSLQGGAGLGNDDEQGVSHIDPAQNTGGIVGVHIADKLSLHLQLAVDLGPVLQRQIDGTGAEIAAADTDLHDGGELLAVGIDQLTVMYLVGKLGELVLLIHIEFPLVDTVSNDILTQLTAAQVVQHAALLAGVDDLAVIKSGILLGQLRLLGKLGQHIQNVLVNGSGSIVEIQTCANGSSVGSDTLGTVLAGHCRGNIHSLQGLKLSVGCQGVHIVPIDHNMTS